MQYSEFIRNNKSLINLFICVNHKKTLTILNICTPKVCQDCPQNICKRPFSALYSNSKETNSF